MVMKYFKYAYDLPYLDTGIIAVVINLNVERQRKQTIKKCYLASMQLISEMHRLYLICLSREIYLTHRSHLKPKHLLMRSSFLCIV